MQNNDDLSFMRYFSDNPLKVFRQFICTLLCSSILMGLIILLGSILSVLVTQAKTFGDIIRLLSDGLVVFAQDAGKVFAMAVTFGLIHASYVVYLGWSKYIPRR